MNNKKWTIAVYVISLLILVVGLIVFGINNHKITQQLELTREALYLAQEALGSETEKRFDLEIELQTANDIVDAMKDEEYIVGNTVTNKEIEMIAKTVWGEARGQDTIEKAAVIWCILNRVDANNQSIAEVITRPNQFIGYSKHNPVSDEIVALTKDVVIRWQMEKECIGNVGRVLPQNYLWFNGYNGDNHFRNAYAGDYDVWDWNCWNPYE